MEKDRIMCEPVQKALKSADPKPDNSPFSELLLGIALQAAYNWGYEDGEYYGLSYQSDDDIR